MAAGNVMKVAMISAMTCRFLRRCVFWLTTGYFNYGASECDSCSGTGAADGSKPSTCGTCGGTGRVRAQQGFLPLSGLATPVKAWGR